MSAAGTGLETGDRFTVAISSRALFALDDAHALFEREGLDAYVRHQIEREGETLAPGIAFPLVRKLLALNAGRASGPRIEVILLSRNSGDTGLRIFNAVEHHGLDIARAAFTSGASPFPYIAPFGAQLFLSTHAEDVRAALNAGVAAAIVLPSVASTRDSKELRIAFDGDAVVFGGES